MKTIIQNYPSASDLSTWVKLQVHKTGHNTSCVIEDNPSKVVDAEGCIKIRLWLQVLLVVRMLFVELLQHGLVCALQHKMHTCIPCYTQTDSKTYQTTLTFTGWRKMWWSFCECSFFIVRTLTYIRHEIYHKLHISESQLLYYHHHRAK